MQRRLEEEHVLQMSLLLAEQEKEQQRLRLVSTWNYTISSLIEVDTNFFFVEYFIRYFTNSQEKQQHNLLNVFCCLVATEV